MNAKVHGRLRHFEAGLLGSHARQVLMELAAISRNVFPDSSSVDDASLHRSSISGGSTPPSLGVSTFSTHDVASFPAHQTSTTTSTSNDQSDDTTTHSVY